MNINERRKCWVCRRIDQFCACSARKTRLWFSLSSSTARHRHSSIRGFAICMPRPGKTRSRKRCAACNGHSMSLDTPSPSDSRGQDLNEWGSVGKWQSALASPVSSVMRCIWTPLPPSLAMKPPDSHGKDMSA